MSLSVLSIARRLLLVLAGLHLVWGIMLLIPWVLPALGLGAPGFVNAGTAVPGVMFLGLGGVLGLSSVEPLRQWALLLAMVWVHAAGVGFAVGGWVAEPGGWTAPLARVSFGVGTIAALGWTLRAAWKQHRAAGAPIEALPAEHLEGYLEMATTQHGESIAALSEDGPVLLVFLRHFGCTFCREALHELAVHTPRIAAEGTRLVLVHMADDLRADAFLGGYGLAHVDRVQDTECDLYRAFGLSRGSFSQLFGVSTWVRGTKAGVWDGHGLGTLEGDGMRMPGVFLVHHRRVVRAYRHDRASARPDYVSLARCETPALC